MRNALLPSLFIAATLISPVYAKTAADVPVNPGVIYQKSLQAMSDIDKEKFAQLWKKSTHVAQESVDEEKFASQVKNNRLPLGKMQTRNWNTISQVVAKENEGDIPPGRYVSVYFITKFDNSMANEMITFREDEDGVWRFSGYLITPQK